MDDQMKQELEKYMQPNGYYDTAAIRRDEGYSAQAAFSWSIYSDDDDQQETRSARVQAAEDYNDAKAEAEKQVNSADAIYEALMSTPAEELKATVYPRGNKMQEDQRKQLVRRLLTEKDEYYAVFTADMPFRKGDAGWEDWKTNHRETWKANRDAAERKYNRCVEMLHAMHLVQYLTNYSVDFIGAINYIGE